MCSLADAMAESSAGAEWPPSRRQHNVTSRGGQPCLFFVRVCCSGCLVLRGWALRRRPRRRLREPIRLSAWAVNMSNMATGTNYVLDIAIDRWSTEEEREALITTFQEKGPDALLRALQKTKSTGRMRVPAWRGPDPHNARLGWDLHYAWQVANPDGGRKIVIATDRYIGFWEARNQPRSIDYPFTLIEIRLDAKGEGAGKMAVATKISFDKKKKVVELENYAERAGPAPERQGREEVAGARLAAVMNDPIRKEEHHDPLRPRPRLCHATARRAAGARANEGDSRREGDDDRHGRGRRAVAPRGDAAGCRGRAADDPGSGRRQALPANQGGRQGQRHLLRQHHASCEGSRASPTWTRSRRDHAGRRPQAGRHRGRPADHHRDHRRNRHEGAVHFLQGPARLELRHQGAGQEGAVAGEGRRQASTSPGPKRCWCPSRLPRTSPGRTGRRSATRSASASQGESTQRSSRSARAPLALTSRRAPRRTSRRAAGASVAVRPAADRRSWPAPRRGSAATRSGTPTRRRRDS